MRLVEIYNLKLFTVRRIEEALNNINNIFDNNLIYVLLNYPTLQCAYYKLYLNVSISKYLYISTTRTSDFINKQFFAFVYHGNSLLICYKLKRPKRANRNRNNLPR